MSKSFKFPDNSTTKIQRSNRKVLSGKEWYRNAWLDFVRTKPCPRQLFSDTSCNYWVKQRTILLTCAREVLDVFGVGSPPGVLSFAFLVVRFLPDIVLGPDNYFDYRCTLFHENKQYTLHLHKTIHCKNSLTVYIKEIMSLLEFL